jgi:hypothetical protein
MNIDIAYVSAAGTVAIAIMTLAGFMLRYEKRLTRTESTAITVLQMAAEADEECKELRKICAAADKEIDEVADRVRHDFGETVSAMQAKIHEFETWSRDNFVRKESLNAMMLRFEKAQEARDERLEKRLDRIETKMDELTTLRAR